MAKRKSIFECQACGFQSPRWLGKCTNCEEWDSMVELTTEQIKFVEETKRGGLNSQAPKATPITEVEQEKISLFSSGSQELDLVLGGGIRSPGFQFTLYIGWEGPWGIGKIQSPS